MRIAFINQSWDEIIPEIGGHSSIPIIAYQLALRVANAGHEVMLYGIKGYNQPTSEKDDNGIIFKRVSNKLDSIFLKPLRFLARLGAFRSSKRPFFASSFHSPGYVIQVAADLKKRQPDIIHIFNFSQYVPIIRAFNPHSKIVLHMQCEWLSQLDPKMIKKRLNHVDLVLGCSDFITQKIQKRYPKFADHCMTTYNGVNPDKFSTIDKSRGEEDKKILFVGRVSPEKGVHILLNAFHIVIAHYPKVHLIIVGPTGAAPFEFVISVSDDDNVTSLASFYEGKYRKDSNYDQYLQQQLTSDEWEQVEFVGSVPHSDVCNYYRNADIFVFSSVWDEPFGIPMVEAMASGLPVVAAQGGAVPEIVRAGTTGLLVDRGDAEAMAHAIVKLLEDQDLSESMGRAGRQRASELFSWDRTTDILLGQYKRLIGE